MNKTLEQIIAGAVYDFAGHLTTLDEPIIIGTIYEAPPLFEQVIAWAYKRGLSLDQPLMNEWKEKANELLTDRGQDPERSGPTG